MKAIEIRQRFIEFFEKQGHTRKVSSSLVPKNDPTVLLTTAGMQQFVPYFLGEAQSPESRYASIQKCFRTPDIEEVGDQTHLTFFEMLGNFSIGDYFKKDALRWSYQLLTSKTEGFGLDPRRLYVTCFAGNTDAPRDEEAAQIWREIFAENGVQGERIYFLGADANWWPAVKKNEDGWTGPTGPCSEMFYDLTGTFTEGMTQEQYNTAAEKQQVVEIWNDVFMEYRKQEGKIVGQLANKNVDTGAGLERMTMVVQGKNNIFETDLFTPILDTIARVAGVAYADHERNFRIIADHLRGASFLAADGVEPGKESRSYIARRVIRRAILAGRRIGITEPFITTVAKTVIEEYNQFYPELRDREAAILYILGEEEKKFLATLQSGLREFEKRTAGVSGQVPGDLAFTLFDTYGFPREMTAELAAEKGLTIDEVGFEAAFAKHREVSRVGVKDQFERKGGGQGDKVKTAHTATHMLHAALRKILGPSVEQAGSQLGDGEFRFDFTYPTKLTDEQRKQVEDLINEKIAAGLNVTKEDMTVEQAKEAGALGIFEEKYGNTVSVYTVHEGDGYFSKEICGGPHVSNTKEIQFFRIVKEKSSSAGIRRIKAAVGKVQA